LKPNKIFKNFDLTREDLWLWLPVLFGLGVAFYLSFSKSFSENIPTISALFFTSLLGYFLNRQSRRSLIFLSCCLFLLGGFYSIFYQKIFLSHTKITGKVYVDVVGKVESVKEFYNQRNGVRGLNLIISKPALYKAKFDKKKSVKKAKKKPKKKAKKVEKKAKSKPKKTKKRVENIENELNSDLSLEKKVSRKRKSEKKDSDESRVKKDEEKSKKPKKKKPKKISEKTIHKNFVNLEGYQEIDRKYLDAAKNYQSINWVKIKGSERFPNPPQKISISLAKGFENIAVNDVVAIRAMLQPPKAKEFSDDFDFALNSDLKKIGAFGFAIGETKIMRKAEISNLDSWFLYLRENIREKILASSSGDSAAIILALLIGDQSQISADLMSKIRHSGLAHLLSISGFHLSLAAAIFFVSTRFLFSRSEYLALNFDLKKISAIVAIIGTFFYLKIADAPIPAQRAFVMVFLALVALFVDEKINARRAIMTAVLLLILFNPFAVLNISFQLSFAAILLLGAFYDKRKTREVNFLRRFASYFWEIILLSIILQIVMAPFLMHSFRNVAMLSFLANALAIPLASFVIMPLGFLALFLMPISLEILPLRAMEHGVLLLQEIAVWVANFNYSNLVTTQFSSSGLAISTIGLLLICLTKNNLRLIGVAIFALSFSTILFAKKPNILFDGNQKFFAIYDQNGLSFSKDLKPSKQRQLWMDKMNEKEFKTFNEKVFCDEKKCVIEEKKKFLVLTSRNKISEICKNDFDVIVNLSRKYNIPDCVLGEKMVIDNFDFYQRGGHFFYLEGDKIILKTSL
jgi:competence protein ComEC